ncbi:MAG: esterase [Firmicutes bacterium]|nr:esterase [Bacillota bacterium]
MREEYHSQYSRIMERQMEWKVYLPDDPALSTGGKICFAFPPQNGRFYDFGNFGMAEVARPWIDAGQMIIVCPDGIDGESWSADGTDLWTRASMQEKWFRYITDELRPKYVREGEKALVCGCSMGGVHAGVFFFRRPDLFDGMISMSGTFNAEFFFHGMNELVYENSPVHFLPNMPQDHPWMDLYRQSQIILCCGQGAWEEELLKGTRELDAVLTAKGIPHWADYWGYDVNHNWDWWQKQFPYFLGHLARIGYL